MAAAGVYGELESSSDVVDVSGMHIGDTFRLSALVVPEGVKLLDDLEGTVLATVTQPTREEEPVVEGEEAEAAEGEAPEGEGEPAADAEGSAED